MNSLQVIKIGGADDIDIEAVCADIARLNAEGRRFVVVHGGSAAATRLGDELGHPAQFVTSPSGHTSRLTDQRTLEIFMMATGVLNRRIVCGLQAAGVRAIGLSGVDGALLRAERKQALRVVENGRTRIVRDDQTGRPTDVNTGLLQVLLDGGFVPVIAPVALSCEDTPLNVDGDRAAALIAGRMRADVLALLTAVPGVMTEFPDEATVVRHAARDAVDDVLAVAAGRMKKKVLGAREALDGGVASVVIGLARGTRPVAAALNGSGTVLGEPLATSLECSR